LRQSEERFRSLVLNTSDMVTILSEDGVIQYQSPSAERIWGYSVEALQQRNVLTLVHVEDLELAQSLFAQAREHPRLSMAVELRLRLADGSWCYFDVVATNLLRDRRVAGIVVTFRDITERKQFEQALTYQAFHDSLTDLPNRALFVDRVGWAQSRAARHSTSLAVMFLDIDNFKVVNDSLGHSAGDELLVALTARIQGCLRREDTLARLGGDELAILAEDVESLGNARQLAERILDALSTPFVVSGHELFASVSIGIVLGGPNHRGADQLLREADLAMYRAKSNGKARSEIFDHVMDARMTERFALESSLRRAIERQELRVHYQPIVDLAAGSIAGLKRWCAGSTRSAA
jgi:diguanylate cyclase (GGDEF)-like protein/PAS domain S-box-containing protein